MQVQHHAAPRSNWRLGDAGEIDNGRLRSTLKAAKIDRQSASSDHAQHDKVRCA